MANNEVQDMKQQISAQFGDKLLLPANAERAGVISLLDEARESTFTVAGKKEGNDLTLANSAPNAVSGIRLLSKVDSIQAKVNFTADKLELGATLNNLYVDSSNHPSGTEEYNLTASVPLAQVKNLFNSTANDDRFNITISDTVKDSAGETTLSQNSVCNAQLDGNMVLSGDCSGAITRNGHDYQFKTAVTADHSTMTITNGDKPVGEVNTDKVQGDDGSIKYNVHVKPAAN